MTVGELRQRLYEFDQDLEVRVMTFAQGDTPDEDVRADLPEHEQYVLLHNHLVIEASPVWTEA